MEKHDCFALGLVIGMVLMLVLWGFADWNNHGNYSRKEIIKHGYGLYCPETGKFAFKGECEVAE